MWQQGSSAVVQRLQCFLTRDMLTHIRARLAYQKRPTDALRKGVWTKTETHAKDTSKECQLCWWNGHGINERQQCRRAGYPHQTYRGRTSAYDASSANAWAEIMQKQQKWRRELQTHKSLDPIYPINRTAQVPYWYRRTKVLHTQKAIKANTASARKRNIARHYSDRIFCFGDVSV